MVKLRCDSIQITSQLAKNVYFPKMNSRNNVKYHLAEVFNKGAIWLYAELKSHISFQVSFIAYLKLSDETWNEMCYLKLLQLFNPSQGLLIWNFWMRLDFSNFLMHHYVAYLKLSDETQNEMCYLELFKLINQSQGLLIWNFQMKFKDFWGVRLFMITSN